MNWTTNLLHWLTTEEGQSLLKEAEALPTDTLTRLTALRKKTTIERANALNETLALRTKARERFSHAEAMLFTRPGLEQATSETVARYHATRLPQGTTLLDACSGIGGDALALLEQSRVLAVDSDPVALTCLQINAQTLLPKRATDLATICADVTQIDLKRLRSSGVQGVLFDPARRITTRAGERRRAQNPEDYAPSLSFLEPLRATFPSLCVKLSPATEESILQRYAHEAEIELISTREECREALLWFGEAKDQKAEPLYQNGEYSYRATILTKSGKVESLLPCPHDPPSYTAPQAWLYEPDPAVIRAHLIPQITAQHGANLITPHIAYMTSATPLEIPFTKAYPILATMSYRPNTIRQWLKANARYLETVKKRGVPFEPEAILKEFRSKTAQGAPVTLVLMPYQEKPLAILCESLSR